MSHILFISPYYFPEKAAAAVCIGETAKRLVKRGHQVTVLTTVPNYPNGIVPAKYRGHVLQQEVLDGVKVVRVWSYVSPNKGFFRRILSQLSFGSLAPLLGGKAIGHPDVIIVQSPPLFDAIAARVLARWKHCPFIFMVSDLWPESAIQFDMLRNHTLIRLSEWLEWSTYQKSRLVWVVSEGVRDLLIRRGLSAEYILLLANGVDTILFHPLSQSQARAELGWKDRFTVLYAGSHGLAYQLTTVLDAAEQMRDDSGIDFLLVGDGARKTELMAEARRRGLKNITFLDPVPHHEVPLLLAAADICLIPQRKVPLLETTLPLKMFEMMACARPLILASTGIAAKLAQEAEAALVIEPENAEALVKAIYYLREHPHIAQSMGMRGRILVETRFDYEQLTSTLDSHITRLLGEGTSADRDKVNSQRYSTEIKQEAF